MRLLDQTFNQGLQASPEPDYKSVPAPPPRLQNFTQSSIQLIAFLMG